MEKREIIEFFKKLSDEGDQYKLTTESIKRIVQQSNFSDDIKNKLYMKIDEHIDCEFEDLEIDPFVVANYGGEESTSLNCEFCSSIIIDNETILSFY